MTEQNYENHVRNVFGYHVVLFAITVLSLIGAIVNVVKSVGDHGNLYSASLILVAWVAIWMTGLYARIFALKAQDRAIRAEENFRHYILTGKPLDPRLTMRQIVGLRFAADEEFVELTRRAIAEGLSEKQIKVAIKNWKADLYRV